MILYSRKWVEVAIDMRSPQQQYQLISLLSIGGLLVWEWCQPGVLRQHGAPALDWSRPATWIQQYGAVSAGGLLMLLTTLLYKIEGITQRRWAQWHTK